MHSGVEPQIVAVRVENHWRPVVDGAYFPTLPHAGFLRVTVAPPSISFPPQMQFVKSRSRLRVDALTSHSSQGQTADRVLIHVDTDKSELLVNNRFA